MDVVDLSAWQENAAKAGVPVPEKLRQTLKQLSAEKTERKDNVK